MPRLAPLLVLGLAAVPALAQEDAGVGAVPFQEGDAIPFGQVDRLKPYLPKPFWDNRDFFFYEGMQLDIGPTQADYSPAQIYRDATERFRGQARIGPDGSLENYTAGQPFPMEEIDCEGDPHAGVKIMWNHDYQWGGGGGGARFHYSYWDRGEQLPLYYRGHSQGIRLSHRSEPEYLENDGDVFRKERRKFATGPTVEAPFDARGITILTYLKDIWIDKQTLTAMYSFAYDHKEELWKIIWHNKRWSEDHSLTGAWYKGWEGVAEPRDLLIVSDIIVNAQTGTGNRIEFWDVHGTPPRSKGRIRRFIDVGRLTRGR